MSQPPEQRALGKCDVNTSSGTPPSPEVERGAFATGSPGPETSTMATSKRKRMATTDDKRPPPNRRITIPPMSVTKSDTKKPKTKSKSHSELYSSSECPQSCRIVFIHTERDPREEQWLAFLAARNAQFPPTTLPPDSALMRWANAPLDFSQPHSVVVEQGIQRVRLLLMFGVETWPGTLLDQIQAYAQRDKVRKQEATKETTSAS